jgi:hypothetical protein
MRLDEAATAERGAHLASLPALYSRLFLGSGGWIRGSVRWSECVPCVHRA